MIVNVEITVFTPTYNRAYIIKMLGSKASL